MASINPSSVILVSGGGRGITARCAVEMAQAFGCRFLLLGRSRLADEAAWSQDVNDDSELKKRALAEMQARGEKPTPTAISRMVSAVTAGREIRDTLAQIAAVGGQALYLSADIGDPAALRQALASAAHLGAVTGIVHGAGNLADKRIEQKTEADFDHVYTAKVEGLANLLQTVEKDRLETLVLFSSVAGFYGNIGQADYAIANEVLNKTAYAFKHQHPHCHVVSINWGPWEGGMVTPTLRAYFDQLGIKVIPGEVGARMLVDELRQEAVNAPVQIVVGSPIFPPPTPPAGDLRTYRLRRTLTLESNPFLADHVVNGQAVLPMVSAMSWMANACEGVYRGYRLFGFTDYRVLKGIVFDDALGSDFVLELKEVRKDVDELVVDVMIRSQNAAGKPRFHYSAQLTLVARLPNAPTYSPPDDPPLEEPFVGERLYQDGTLFHGYSFQGVQEVFSLNEQGLIMRCQLPRVDDAYQGQFPVQAFNYFMVDIGLQSIGTWARKRYDMGSLPLRAGRGEFFGDAYPGQTFYVTMRVESHTEFNVTATITLYDEQFLVIARISQLEVTMSKRLNELFLNNRLPDRLPDRLSNHLPTQVG